MKRRPQEKMYVEGRMVTKARVVVTEALHAQGKEGATKEELLMLVGEEIGGERPMGAIGLTITALIHDEEVVEVRGKRGMPDRYYLKDCAPQEQGSGPAPYASNGQRAQVLPAGGNGKIAPFALKRTGKVVSVFTSPRVFEDAIALSLKMDGEWFKIPLFGSARICYGQEAPMWSPDQEMYTGVEEIKIGLRNGQFSIEHPAPKDIVTIAPE